MFAFLLSMFFIFIAEMGDKTQLVALAFATRYKASTVIAGVFLATALVHVFSVLLGEAAGQLLPVWLVQVASGLAFIGFGIWTLKGDELDENEEPKGQNLRPLLAVALTFFLAEMGDKTMLATITIASQQKSFFAVWLGSTLGMVLADGLAILVGKQLGQRLPERAIQMGAAAVFIISGCLALASLVIHV